MHQQQQQESRFQQQQQHRPPTNNSFASLDAERFDFKWTRGNQPERLHRYPEGGLDQKVCQGEVMDRWIGGG